MQIDQELAEEEENERNSLRDAGTKNPVAEFSEPQPHTQPDKDKPSFDRSSKPEAGRSPTSGVPVIPDRATKPTSALYSSGGLRTIHVPSMLMAKFLSLAGKIKISFSTSYRQYFMQNIFLVPLLVKIFIIKFTNIL